MTNLLKRTGVNVILTAASVLFVSSAQAGVIVEWDFGSSTLPSSASSEAAGVSTTPSPPSLSVAAQSGITTSIASSKLTLGFTKGNATDLNGEIITMTIKSSTGNFNTFSAAFTTSFTTLNALQGTWKYQINGGTLNTISPIETITSGVNNSPALTGISMAAGDVLTLEFVLSGASASNQGNPGNVSFSTFQVSAVPEPVNYALAGFGVLFAGSIASRFYRARRAAAV